MGKSLKPQDRRKSKGRKRTALESEVRWFPSATGSVSTGSVTSSLLQLSGNGVRASYHSLNATLPPGGTGNATQIAERGKRATESNSNKITFEAVGAGCSANNTYGLVAYHDPVRRPVPSMFNLGFPSTVDVPPTTLHPLGRPPWRMLRAAFSCSPTPRATVPDHESVSFVDDPPVPAAHRLASVGQSTVPTPNTIGKCSTGAPSGCRSCL